MMKTVRILVLLLVCFLLLPSVMLSADSIYIPEDEFLEQHEDQMVELRRNFIANGEDGFAALREAPGAKGETGRLQNGEKTRIYYACLYDGEYWGISDDGWIRMDQLLVMYDYVSFEKDHFDELYLYKGDCEKLKETLSAIAWPWPGADAPLWTTEDIEMEYFSITYAYLDSQGREWAFVDSRYDGYIWICMSDLMNSNIPAFNPAPEPTKWVPERKYVVTKIEPTDNTASGDSTVTGVSTESTDNTASVVSTENTASNTSGVSTESTDNTASEVSIEYTDINASENSTLWLIVVLVVVLVACTAVLIKVFWKPKKNENRE